MYNLREFKALIKKYRSIKATDVNPAHTIAQNAMFLTGFGSSSTCTLCLAIGIGCDGCVYKLTRGAICSYGDNYRTYFAIKNAKTAQELVDAYQARADHMENLLKEKGVL